MAGGLVFDFPVNKNFLPSNSGGEKSQNEVFLGNVVLIMCQPISDKIIADYYLHDILNEGFSFEYWDISEILFDRRYDLAKTMNLGFQCIGIKTMNDFKKRISEIDRANTLFIPQITYDDRSYKIFRVLTRFACQTAFFARGAARSHLSRYRPLWPQRSPS